MAYDPAAIAAYFDAWGAAEWDRFDGSLGDRISLALHSEALERFVPPGSRVLDVGAGPGRFTEVLHRLGCRIVVADLSPVQLELNRERAAERGFDASVEAWLQLDLCDLAGLEDGGFDAVVAYGGPFSYVFERRDQALAACQRVLGPGGVLCLSVMSLWGSLHRFLPDALCLPPDTNRAILASGDLSPATAPDHPHHCHMFRAHELRDFLERPGLELLHLSASSAISTGHDADLATDDESWPALLEFERQACSEPGQLDAGTHLIAVVRRAS